MSHAVPTRPRKVSKASHSFAIVASQYNATYVQPMVDNAYYEINELEPGASVVLLSAPGSFEIPLLVKLAAEQEKYSAILALGVILQGETSHAVLIGQAVTTALMQISLESRIPVIHEVLLLDNEAQAKARCIDKGHNRGVEAARAAVAAARSVQEIKESA
jgi:6,7-dimethyl-8-ribityllumazine synthase